MHGGNIYRKLFVFVFVFSSFIFGKNIVLATIDYSISQTSYGVNIGRNIIGQNFHASSTYISGVSVYAGTSNSPHIWYLHFCKGYVSSGQQLTKKDCTGDVLIASTSCIVSIGSFTNCSFGYRYAVNTGEDYYFTAQMNSLNNSFGAATSNIYANGGYFGIEYGGTDALYSTNDLTFKIFDDNSLTINGDETFIEFTKPFFGETYSVPDFKWLLTYGLSSSAIASYYYNDIYTQIEYCRIGDICPEAESAEWLNKIIVHNGGQANTFLPANQLLYDFENNNPLLIPSKLGDYSGTTTLIAHSAIGVNTTLAYATSSWTMGTTTTDDDLISVPTGWCSGLCVDLDPSLTNPVDYLVCAGRRIFCYAFIPDPRVLNDTQNIYADLKLTFPFNTYYQLASTTNFVFSNTATSSNDTFGIPFIRKTGATTTEYYILPILSSSSVPNLIGQTNSTLLRNSLGYFLWVCIAFLIYVQIKNI